MRNIALILEYDGTPYVGWQAQENLPSVQAALELAIAQITLKTPVNMSCAGRTDAGVHAYCQVVNFFLEHHLPARRFVPGLNHYLPSSIRVHAAYEMTPQFNAREHTVSKRYRYRIYQGPHPPALDHRRVWHIRRSLDIQAMRQAAFQLVGELDFNAFRSTHCDAAHARRHMYSVVIHATPRPPVGLVCDIVFHANAFCRHMCRILAGTLVEIGTGKRDIASVAQALHSKKREDAGVTAPPWGLCLLETIYAEPLLGKPC